MGSNFRRFFIFCPFQNITLHFVVLSFDRYSRDDVIGEIIAPLNQLDLANAESCLALARDIQPRSLKVKITHFALDNITFLSHF